MIRHLRLRSLLLTQHGPSSIPRGPPLSAALTRAFHDSPSSALSYQDPLDRNVLSPRRAEYTVSGWDDEVAEHPEVAFNPSENRPEYEKEMCTKNCTQHSNGSPLEYSAANRDVSSQTDENTGDKSDKRVKSWGTTGKASNKKHGHA